MEKALKELLENEVLSEDTKEELSEAWNRKLQEAEQRAEQKLREEFSQRFEHDKGLLVEAMDRMLSDAIRDELNEFAQDRKALANQRVKLSKAIRESKGNYNKKLAEHAEKLQGFVVEQLQRELKEFHADKKDLQEQRVKVAKQLREARQQYKKEAAQRVNVLESFVINQLTKEVSEFHQDKKALAESRVKMVTEGKKKIDETRKAFIKRAAGLVEGTIDDVVRKEMTQLHEDIKASRQNDFGRRIFEAFADEYMASYLSEGSKVKDLMSKISDRERKLNEAMQKLEKQQKLLENANRKVTLVEEKSKRSQTLQELLGPLSKDKKAVMEELLDGVKTSNLREAFHRYLPTVLNESGSARRVSQRVDSARKTLTENEKGQQAPKKAITGNRQNRLAESANAETKNNEEDNKQLAEIRKLAGIAN
jgi:hypothetical protein